MRGTLVSAALVTVVVGLLAVQLTAWTPRHISTATPWPVPAAGSVAPRLTLGVTTVALARDSYRAWAKRDLREVDDFEQAARRHSDVVMWFADWQHVANFGASQAAAVAARGSIPEISWEPWDATAGPVQPRYRLANIISGTYDAYISRWAHEIAAYGAPVMIRFAQEMNGRSYPWAERANGNSSGQYVEAWRHVHAIFGAAGAGNVKWVWAPVAGSISARLYPGPDEVDVIGVSGFIAPHVFRGVWRPFAVAFGHTLDTLHRLDPSKPVSLAEIGVAGGGGHVGAWIRGMFAEIRRRPYIRSLVWFNLRKEADWRISASRSEAAAFAAGLRAVS
jgi:beta-mannanase